MLNPGLNTLAGSMVHASRLMADTVVEVVGRTATASPARTGEQPAVRARHGPLAGALGAAGIVHQRRSRLYDTLRVVHRSFQ